MARGGSSGGSRGGGSRSGGSRGGSFRSSGGSRSSGRSSSRSSFSSGTHMNHTYYHGPRTSVYVGDGARTTLHMIGFIWSLVIIAIAFIIMASIFIQLKSDVRPSTMDREPMDAKYVTVTNDWIRDDIGWIRSEYDVKAGLRHFHEKTGVMPYLVLVEDVHGDTSPTGQELWDYGNEIYNAMFTDEGHMVFVFQCVDETDDYTMAAVVGNNALLTIDNEALEILYDYIDSYFYSDRTEDELFADAFADAADRFMVKTPDVKITLAKIVSPIVALIIVFAIVRTVAKRKKEKAEETQRILETPLEHLDAPEE